MRASRCSRTTIRAALVTVFPLRRDRDVADSLLLGRDATLRLLLLVTCGEERERRSPRPVSDLALLLAVLDIFDIW